MRSGSLLIRAATLVPLLIGCAVLSAAGGVIIRDIGAGAGFHPQGPILPLGTEEVVFNAYELTYTLAVFSSVRVAISVEAPFYDWRVDFGESTGSFVATFRPPSPGIHRVVVTNVEPREGQIAVTLEQLSDFPPEFETSLLIPLAGIAAVSLTVSGTFLVVSIRLKRMPA